VTQETPKIAKSKIAGSYKLEAAAVLTTLLFLIFGYIPATSEFGTTMLGMSVFLFVICIIKSAIHKGSSVIPAVIGTVLTVIFCLFPTPYTSANAAAKDAKAQQIAQQKEEAKEKKKAAEKKKKAEQAARNKAKEEAKAIAAMEASNATATPKVAGSDALDVLVKLAVKGRAPKAGYDRDEFGPNWADVDHNGCDTRNDILKRDLSEETFETNNCVILTGKLNDPYTATLINFQSV